MSTDHIRYEARDTVALIAVDDGKANALSPALIAALRAELDRAESEGRAVLLAGREKRLSGGFDLGVMTGEPSGVKALVTAGAELMLRLYTFPRPVIVACTGHALAAGAILLLAADYRVGAQGDFKLGLNEVAIQLRLPIFAQELARDRLSKRHFTQATTQARIYDPDKAVDAGYLDEVASAEELLDTALAHARRLAALPADAFRGTKINERSATVRMIRDTLAADMDRLVPV